MSSSLPGQMKDQSSALIRHPRKSQRPGASSTLRSQGRVTAFTSSTRTAESAEPATRTSLALAASSLIWQRATRAEPRAARANRHERAIRTVAGVGRQPSIRPGFCSAGSGLIWVSTAVGRAHASPALRRLYVDQWPGRGALTATLPVRGWHLPTRRSLSFAGSGDECGDEVGGGGLHGQVDVAVGVEGDADVGVPETLLYDAGVDAGLEREGGVGVAQVV